MKIHHLGYAVRDLEASIPGFEKLGFEKMGFPVHDAQRQVNIQMLKNDPWMIELVAPFSETSPILRILEKNNNTPYHFCYVVDNMEKTIEELRAVRYILIEPPQPAMAFNGQLVAFLYHRDIGLIELLAVN